MLTGFINCLIWYSLSVGLGNGTETTILSLQLDFFLVVIEYFLHRTGKLILLL